MKINFLQLFNEIQKEFLDYCFEYVKKYNIKMADMRCILFLHNNHPLDTARDIVHHQKMSPAMVSKSIDELKSLGYADTVRDSSDSRYVHIILTDRASDLLRDLDRAQDEFSDRLTEGISKESIDIMNETAVKMGENLARNII